MTNGMTLRHVVPLSCAYLIGWAVVLAALIFSARGGIPSPAFLVIQAQENAFIGMVGMVWACYTVPCLFIALVLWELLREV